MSATSKLVKAWESKTNQRAMKAGGGLTMALTLAACGGTDITQAQLDAETAAAEAAAAAQAAAEAEAAAAAQAAAEAEAADAAAAQAAAEEAAAQAELDALFVPGAPVLTTDADNVSSELSLGNDTIDATLRNSLETGDQAVDASSTDADVLNANVSGAAAQPTLGNIEAVNITGAVRTVNFDLVNVTGTQTLTLNTELANGTATLTGADSAAASNVVAGANVDTLNIDAAATGTNGVVTVSAGSASTITLDGGADDDSFNVSVAADADIDLGLGTAFTTDDAVELTLAGDVTLSGDAGLGSLVLNVSDDTTVVVNTATATGTADGDELTIAGSGDVTLDLANSNLIAATTVSSAAGTLTLDLATITDNDDVSDVAADVIAISGNAAGALVLADSSVVNLTGDAAGTAGLGAAAHELDTDAVGTTLVVNVSETQTTSALVLGATNAATALVSATPDEASDTADGAEITIADLDMTALTDAVLQLGGAGDLTITDLSHDAADIVLGSAMTGDLTITGGNAGADALEIETGAGADSVTTVGGADTITTNAGDDTIDAGAGNDTIDAGAGDDTVDAGAGDDTVDAGLGANTLTLGAGADTVTLTVDDAVNDGTDDTEVTDFVIGTDTLVLNGTTTDTTIDVSDVAVTDGVYTIATGDFIVELTGNSSTDLSASVQLGEEDGVLVLADGSDVTAGDADDHVAVAGGDAATVAGGAGADTFYQANGAGGFTISDFVVGADKVVLHGTTTAGVDLTIVSSDGDGMYDDIENGVFDVTLTGNTTTDITGLFQLGSENNSFTLTADNTVVGGDFADYITGSGAGTGTESITGGLGADIIDVAVDGTNAGTVVVAAGDSVVGGHDEYTGFDVDGTGNTVLDLDSANIGAVFTDTQVGDITGMTVSDGVITAFAGIDNTVDDTTLDDVLAYLGVNVGGTDTVAFEYTADENGDCDTSDTGETSTFVFQNGSTDTVVELIGVTGITDLATAAAANAVVIA